MKLYFCDEIKISYEELIKLHKAKKIALTLDIILAFDILANRNYRPGGNTYLYIFFIIICLTIGVFAFSIYLSFTSAWWYFIPGLLITWIMWNANRRSVADNLTGEAFKDKNYYEKIRKIKGWVYRMDEADAKRYLK